MIATNGSLGMSKIDYLSSAFLDSAWMKTVIGSVMIYL